MLIFASTNDSVQFHEEILRTFINRKFSLYLDNNNNIDNDIDMIDDNNEENLNIDRHVVDADDFIANEDGDGFEMNLKKNMHKKMLSTKTKEKTKVKKSTKKISVDNGKNLIDVFALYGNMDQHKRAEILSRYCQSDSGLLICTVIICKPYF